MLYNLHTNSKPAVGKEGKKILLAAKSGKPIVNKAAATTIESIVARHNIPRKPMPAKPKFADIDFSPDSVLLFTRCINGPSR